jgi:tetratricopeptide (TPR) repeat protein
MSDPQKSVFISYRHIDEGWATAIYKHLDSYGYDVFMDYHSINSGDFEQIILGNLKARAHFVLILTPSALERCHEPNDWLRREIETAIEYKRNVVPITVEGFSFSNPTSQEYLTGRLDNLKKYNALNIPTGYFDEAMKRLTDRYLNIDLSAVLHTISAAAQAYAQQQHKEVATAFEWFEKGSEAFKYGDMQGAIYCYSEAISLKPNYSEAYNDRGVAYANQGNLIAAVQDYNNSIKFGNFERHIPYLNRGNAYKDMTDLERAEADYSRAIDISPNDANAYSNRGGIRTRLGNLEEAIKDCTNAIRLKPDFAEAYNNRGLAYEAQSNFELAINDFSYAIILNPDLALAYNNRGNVYKKLRVFDEAIKDFDKAIDLNPYFLEAYSNRALLKVKQLDIRGAIADWDKAIEIKPNEPILYNNRGNLWADLNDLNGAKSDYDQAIRLKPDFDEAYYNRAGIKRKQGDLSGAIGDYQIYLDLGGGRRYGDQEDVEEKIVNLRNLM